MTFMIQIILSYDDGLDWIGLDFLRLSYFLLGVFFDHWFWMIISRMRGPNFVGWLFEIGGGLRKGGL
jgi:hypothetical protein